MVITSLDTNLTTTVFFTMEYRLLTYSTNWFVFEETKLFKALSLVSIQFIITSNSLSNTSIFIRLFGKNGSNSNRISDNLMQAPKSNQFEINDVETLTKTNVIIVRNDNLTKPS